MMRKILLVVSTALAAVLVLGAAPALASHFRASESNLSYDSSTHTLTWNLSSAWRKGRDDQMLYDGSGVSITDSNGNDVTSSVTSDLVSAVDDTSNPLYDLNYDTVTMDVGNLLSTPGTYSAYVTNCCRVADVQNTDSNDSFSQAVSWTVNSDGSVDLPPTFTNTNLYALLPISSNNSFSVNFAATDPENDAITYTQMNDTGAPDYGASQLPCSSYVNGVLTVASSLCASGDVYSDIYQAGQFFAFKTKATDSAGDYTETDMLLRVPAVPEPTISDISVDRGTASVSISATDTVVDNYDVTCTNTGDNTDVQTASSSTQPVTITGLSPNATYSCVADATNGLGTGTSSAYSFSTADFQPQTITFTQPADVHDSDSSPTLAATASSGLPVTFSSTTPSVCTVTTDGTVTLVADGTCTIAADQAGDGTHNPAPQVVHSFQVLPNAPTAPGLTSGGTGMQMQSVQVTIPTNGSVTLVSGNGTSANTVTIPGEGTYVLDPTSGTITFIPASGFSGTPTPVTYKVTDSYGQSTDGLYTATVTKPSGPSAAPMSTHGAHGQTQQTHIAIPAGGSATLLNDQGKPVSSLTYPHQGTFTLDPATGILTFTPAAGYHGGAMAVRYQVTDAYGQLAVAAYTVHVATQAATHKVGAVAVTAPRVTKSVPKLHPTCRQTSADPAAAKLTSCTVTAYARIHGKRVVVGTGHRHLGNPARTMAVTVHLNKLGKALANRPGGDRVILVARMAQAGIGSAHYATARTRTVRPTVSLRPVLFAFNSAHLTHKARMMLVDTRHHLGPVDTITCTGFADYAGNNAHEKRLSQARAHTVCAVLSRHHHVGTHVVAHGQTHRFARGGTALSRIANRRVQIALKY